MRITPVGKQDDPFPNIPKKEVKEASLSKTAALDPLVLVNSSDKMIDKLNEPGGDKKSHFSLESGRKNGWNLHTEYRVFRVTTGAFHDSFLEEQE
jgi:hypothetical protein